MHARHTSVLLFFLAAAWLLAADTAPPVDAGLAVASREKATRRLSQQAGFAYTVCRDSQTNMPLVGNAGCTVDASAQLASSGSRLDGHWEVFRRQR